MNTTELPVREKIRAIGMQALAWMPPPRRPAPAEVREGAWAELDDRVEAELRRRGEPATNPEIAAELREVPSVVGRSLTRLEHAGRARQVGRRRSTFGQDPILWAAAPVEPEASTRRPPSPRRIDPRPSVRDAILAALAGGPLGRQALVARTGRGLGAVSRQCQRLRGEGLIRATPDGWALVGKAGG